MVRVRGRCSFCSVAQKGLLAVPRVDKEGTKMLICFACVKRLAGYVADTEAKEAVAAASVIKKAPKRRVGRPRKGES